jgi:excisionase family DNA binding protein
MVTVLEAAKRLGRDPETIRRWIRSGKLPAEKIGLQHMIDEADLPGEATVPLPESWRRTITGEPMPDVVAAVRRARAGH